MAQHKEYFQRLTLAFVIALAVSVLQLHQGPAASATPSMQAALPYAGSLYNNQTLYSGGILAAGDYKLVMQTDGNLVLYFRDTTAIWSPMLNTPGSRLVMQGDGNLVVYRPNNSVAWTTNTFGVGATRLLVQTDGNLVIYGGSFGSVSAKWLSGTSITPYGSDHPDDSNHGWYFDGAACVTPNAQEYLNNANWAMSVLDSTTIFSTVRVYNSAARYDVRFYCYNSGKNGFEALTNCENLFGGTCYKYKIGYNMAYHVDRPTDKGPVFCHEVGHTVGLWHGEPGESNTAVLDAEKSCLRGNPDVHKYGARNIYYLDQLF